MRKVQYGVQNGTRATDRLSEAHSVCVNQRVTDKDVARRLRKEAEMRKAEGEGRSADLPQSQGT